MARPERGQGTQAPCYENLEYLEYAECLAVNLRLQGSQDDQGTQDHQGKQADHLGHPLGRASGKAMVATREVRGVETPARIDWPHPHFQLAMTKRHEGADHATDCILLRRHLLPFTIIDFIFGSRKHPMFLKNSNHQNSKPQPHFGSQYFLIGLVPLPFQNISC